MFGLTHKNKLKVTMFFLLISLFLFKTPNIRGLYDYEIDLSLNWSKGEYYQGDTGYVVITLNSDCDNSLSIYWIGIHFEWQQTGYYYPLDLGENPASVSPNGVYTFEPIHFSVDSDVKIGWNSFHVMFLAQEVHWYGSTGESWTSENMLININSVREMQIIDRNPRDEEEQGKIVTFSANILDELGNPLEGALVNLYLDGSPINSKYSDSQGRVTYQISLDEGTYRWYLQAIKSGYKTKKSSIRTFTVVNKYSLTILSEHSEVIGSGIYEKGEEVIFSVKEETVTQDGVRYIFLGWTSEDFGGYTSSENPASIILQNNVIETAEWKKQVYLSIDSDEGGSIDLSSSWFDEGTGVKITATPSYGHNHKGWMINENPEIISSNPLRITVTNQTVVRAVFEEIKKIYVKVNTDFGVVQGSGYYFEGDTITLSIPKKIIDIQQGNRVVFEKWIVNSSEFLTEDINIPLEGKLEVEVLWTTQYYLDVDSETNIRGEGWYNADETITIEAPSDFGFPLKKVFKGWTGDLESPDNEIQFKIDSPKTVNAVYDYHYVFIGGVSVFILSLMFGVYKIASIYREDVSRSKEIENYKEYLLNEIDKLDIPISLDEVGKRFNISNRMVLRIIETYISDGSLSGKMSEDKKTYYTIESLRKRILEELKKK